MDFQGFLGPTSGSPHHKTWNDEQSLNLISLALKAPSRGKPGQWRLVGTPGARAFATTGLNAPLDLWAQDDRMWAVSRDFVYEVDEFGTMTSRGSVVGDARLTRFTTNGDLAHELLVNTGGLGYILNLETHVLTQITDPEFLANARGAVYIDGNFIVFSDDSLAFALSDSLAGANWSGLDQAEKSTTTDRLKGIVVDGNKLVMLGTKRGEIWGLTGDPSFPLSPIDDVIIEQGLLAPDSLVHMGFPVWLGADEHGGGGVYRMVGYEAQRISTTELEEQWATYSSMRDAYAWTYKMHEQRFYVLTFPQGGTFVWNATTELWHRWSTYNTLTANEDPHLGRSHAYCWEKHFVSDRRTGVIYTLEPQYHYDGAVQINRMRRAPHIAAEDHLLINSRFALDVQTGGAAVSGYEPYWRLKYSDDAGKTYGYFMDASLGGRGAYGTPVEWTRLGSFEKGRTFELWFSDPQFVGINGAYLDLEQG